MDRYRETFDTWNNISSMYQDKFMHLDLYNDTYDHLCKAIDKPNAKLLDIGCGPGNITRYLLAKRLDFDIFGIDISPNMIELARLNNPGARFAVMDSRNIDALVTEYDGIVSGFCLPYLSLRECEKLISDAYCLLNRNGCIYLSFVDGDPDKSDFKVGVGGRVYFNYHEAVKIKSLLVRAKFEAIEVTELNYRVTETEMEVHAIITARKK